MSDFDALYEIAETGGGTTNLLAKPWRKMRSHNMLKVQCPRGHPYTEGNIRYLLTKRGYRVRQCRTCHRLRQRKDFVK